MKVVFSYKSGNWAKGRVAYDFQPKRATLNGQKLNPDDRLYLSMSKDDFRRLFPNSPIKYTSKAARERYGQ